VSQRQGKIQVDTGTVPGVESQEQDMSEQETITPAEAAEIVETEDSENPEDETHEEELPPPNLDELPEGKKVLALGMQQMAESARQEYLKVYGILDAQGDPAKLLAAARETSEDDNVKTLVAQAQELQSQIDNVLAQADQILRDTGAVDVLSDEDIAAKREELDSHKSAFLDSVNYGEAHVVEGFGRLFEDLPGMRKRRAKSQGGSDYTMTTSIKPKVSEIVVNGTDVKNDKGNATFTYLAQYLKKDSGKSVPVGDLHKAWLAAAKTENVEEIKDAVFFDFPVGDKSYSIKIVPKEAA
jgi:hypothetical protein